MSFVFWPSVSVPVNRTAPSDVSSPWVCASAEDAITAPNARRAPRTPSILRLRIIFMSFRFFIHAVPELTRRGPHLGSTIDNRPVGAQSNLIEQYGISGPGPPL